MSTRLVICRAHFNVYAYSLSNVFVACVWQIFILFSKCDAVRSFPACIYHFLRETSFLAIGQLEK